MRELNVCVSILLFQRHKLFFFLFFLKIVWGIRWCWKIILLFEEEKSHLPNACHSFMRWLWIAIQWAWYPKNSQHTKHTVYQEYMCFCSMQMQIIITIFPACYIYISILSSQSQSIEWNMQNTPIYVTLQYRLHHLTRWHDFVFKSECYFSQQFRPIYIKRPKEWVWIFWIWKKEECLAFTWLFPLFSHFFFCVTPRIQFD